MSEPKIKYQDNREEFKNISTHEMFKGVIDIFMKIEPITVDAVDYNALNINHGNFDYFDDSFLVTPVNVEIIVDCER